MLLGCYQAGSLSRAQARERSSGSGSVPVLVARQPNARLLAVPLGGTTLVRTGDRQSHHHPKRTSEPHAHRLHG